jgi:hypothetical protein
MQQERSTPVWSLSPFGHVNVKHSLASQLGSSDGPVQFELPGCLPVPTYQSPFSANAPSAIHSDSSPELHRVAQVPSPPPKDSTVVMEDPHSYNRQRKLKIKSRKSDFKLVQDMLTKKWIIVKNDRQLRDLVEVVLLLEALRMPL